MIPLSEPLDESPAKTESLQEVDKYVGQRGIVTDIVDDLFFHFDHFSIAFRLFAFEIFPLGGESTWADSITHGNTASFLQGWL